MKKSKKSRVVTFEQIDSAYLELMLIKQEYRTMYRTLRKQRKAFDTLMNRASNKTVAEWARTANIFND